MHLELPEKMYYKIGEISKAMKVNASLIRFWEKEFSVLKPKKDKNGKRIFTPKEVEILTQIYFLVKEKGYTLEGAKQKLKEGIQMETDEVIISKKQQVVMKLEKIKNELINIRNSINS